MAALEGLVGRLEGRIEALRKGGRDLGVKEESHEEEGGGLVSTPGMVVGDRDRRREASDIDDLVGDFGFLCVLMPLI